jgi:hypothetical protein
VFSRNSIVIDQDAGGRLARDDNSGGRRKRGLFAAVQRLDLSSV